MRGEVKERRFAAAIRYIFSDGGKWHLLLPKKRGGSNPPPHFLKYVTFVSCRTARGRFESEVSDARFGVFNPASFFSSGFLR